MNPPPPGISAWLLLLLLLLPPRSLEGRDKDEESERVVASPVDGFGESVDESVGRS